MSLDINLVYPIETYSDIPDIEYIDVSDIWHKNQVDTHLNITHNCGEIASEVKIQYSKFNLYDVLWRPYRLYDIKEDSEEFYTFRAEPDKIIKLLVLLTEELRDKPHIYKVYNPSNGCGDYSGLIHFCQKYIKALKRYPNAKIEVSR